MSLIKAIGYLALGVGFIVNAHSEYKGSNSPGQPLGRSPTSTPPLGVLGARRRKRLGGLGDAGPDTGKVKVVDVKTIDQRVKLIKGQICRGSIAKEIEEAGSEILRAKCRKSDGSKTWCVPEKDSLAETRALFAAVRDPNSKYALRYTSDNGFADVFTSARRTLTRKNTADCDDYAITLGALLTWAGHPVKVRVIQTQDKKSWSHVYLLTPKNHFKPDGPWIAVDASVQKPLGWEAPGAAVAALSGRPSGITTKVRDFDVACRSIGK